MDMKQRYFIKFLKQHNCYKQFVEAFDKYNKKNKDYPLSKFIERNEYSTLINAAFLWGRSDNFSWMKINEQWKEYCKWLKLLNIKE